MAEERKPKKSLAKTQYELETKKARDGKLPPWLNAQNENTRRDLKRFNVEQIREAIYAALDTGKHPEELEKLRVLANALDMAYNRIAKTKTKAPKNRERVEATYRELEQGINDLENATGFDLLNKDTW